MVGPIAAETGRRYELSFLKATVGEPPKVAEGALYGGFHLDTHPDVDGDGEELARILVNLAPTPRALRVAAIDRWELARRGCPVERGDYQVVDLPPGVGVRVIEIPPLGDGAAFAVRFWASVVPHVGIERPEGHFLASYEAVAAYPGAP